jgi:hypothetical protein
MTTLHIPSTTPLASVCDALRSVGLEPDARHQRGAVTFRPIVGKALNTPQARIRAAARRSEVRP